MKDNIFLYLSIKFFSSFFWGVDLARKWILLPSNLYYNIMNTLQLYRIYIIREYNFQVGYLYMYRL